MCGIFGALSTQHDVVANTLKGLKRLEYRGYDSAGVAYLNNGIHYTKSIGGVDALTKLISAEELSHIQTAIGHTRWATHGAVTQENAHPHLSYDQALIGVHNGIIENASSIKQSLISQGVNFQSDTDSEVAINLIASLTRELGIQTALVRAMDLLKGSYAIAVLMKNLPDSIFILSHDRAVVLGRNKKDELFFASDEYALYPFVDEIAHCDKNEIIHLERNKLSCFIHQEPKFWICDEPDEDTAKENFMENEIAEQPYIFQRQQAISALHFHLDQNIKTLHFIACGTSYHAALVAKYWFLEHTNLNICVELASEYRYTPRFIDKSVAVIALSQSGETADTLSALRFAKEQAGTTIAICNVAKSSIAREVDHLITLDAGREFGVASTKAFTAQLIRLYQLLQIFNPTCTIDFDEIISLSKWALTQQSAISEWANKLLPASSALFIGRLVGFPLALEASLKLKEITYIHAEAYPAGELKHGPIALIDENMPTIAIASRHFQFEKTISNVEEIVSRKGPVLMISDKPTPFSHCITVPPTNHPLSFAIASTILLQQLALEVCQLKALNPDKPRNLAKSVTVE